MITNRQIRRIVAVTMAVAFSGVVLSSQASDASASGRAQKGSAGTCEQARQFAWFKRQLELTDGDTNPFAKIDTPAECVRVETATK